MQTLANQADRRNYYFECTDVYGIASEFHKDDGRIDPLRSAPPSARIDGEAMMRSAGGRVVDIGAREGIAV